MVVLAVETASPAPAAAILTIADGSSPERFVSVPLGDRGAEMLPGRVQELLALAGGSLSDVDRIVVATGPGSFTGLRAGVAFCRGLARALGRPVHGFGTFEAAASALSGTGDADLLLEAGRGEVYRARRRSGRVGDPTLVRRDDAIREAAEGGIPAVDLGVSRLPLAEALARLAAAAPSGASADGLASPGYGRKSAAEERFGPPGETAP